MEEVIEQLKKEIEGLKLAFAFQSSALEMRDLVLQNIAAANGMDVDDLFEAFGGSFQMQPVVNKHRMFVGV